MINQPCPWSYSFHPPKPKLSTSPCASLCTPALLQSPSLLHIWAVDCAHYRPCRSAFSMPPGAPPSKTASHLLVSFRSPGLSCAFCPAQSGPWQGGASLWNHTSQLFTLGLRHPTPHPTAPSPPCLYFTLNVNGSLLEKKKEKGRKRGMQRNKEATACWACFMGFRGTVSTAATAGRESQLKPRLNFIPVWFLRFTLASLYHWIFNPGAGKSDIQCLISSAQKSFMWRDDNSGWLFLWGSYYAGQIKSDVI